MPLKKVSSLKKASSMTGISALILYLSLRFKERLDLHFKKQWCHLSSKQEASNKKKEETPNKEEKEGIYCREVSVNFLLPSYFQVITKVYKDGKEEKRYIWAANFRVQSLERYGRGSLSPSPILILRIWKESFVFSNREPFPQGWGDCLSL